MWPIFAVLPVIRLSMAITRWPSASKRSVRCDPKKPAAPVTTETGWDCFLAIARYLITEYSARNNPNCICHFQRSREWSEWEERHGRLHGEGSCETVADERGQ